VPSSRPVTAVCQSLLLCRCLGGAGELCVCVVEVDELTVCSSRRSRHRSIIMASRFSVNKADPSVFISADDVRDDGGSSSPVVTVDSPRLSTGSSGKPSSVDAANNETAAGCADDQPAGNRCFLSLITMSLAYHVLKNIVNSLVDNCGLRLLVVLQSTPYW